MRESQKNRRRIIFPVPPTIVPRPITLPALIFLAYLGVLFAVAQYAERYRPRSTALTYALSLTVYCTAWTFLGSVGRAATAGLSFLPIYLGPLFVIPFFWAIVGKTIRISKAERLSSLADFLSARFGQSRTVGAFVALFLLVSVVPYIALQIKAIAGVFRLLGGAETAVAAASFFRDEAFYLTVALGIFIVGYGVRRLDPNERHSGIVAAIGFEAVFKLCAFLAGGIYVTYGLFNGFRDIFGRFTQVQGVENMGQWLWEATPLSLWDWVWLTFISMVAFVLLPRQYHVAVVENEDEKHTRGAGWFFTLYLVLINVFVIPIALGGLLVFGGEGINPDYFILDLPLINGERVLAFAVGLGGFAAATGMAIVSTIALSLMLTNGVVLPLGLAYAQRRFQKTEDLGRTLLTVRRGMIILVLLLAYGYFRLVAADISLVSIGLISFAAVAQFAPAYLGALYWKWTSKVGVLLGLILGFAVWTYTLAVPTLAEAGIIGNGWVVNGPFGVRALRPEHLFFDVDVHPVVNGASWSLLFNVLGVTLGSAFARPSALELSQAALFVDFDEQVVTRSARDARRRSAQTKELHDLLLRFIGPDAARDLIARFPGARGRQAPPELIQATERQLAGLVGAASARTLLRGVITEEPVPIEEVIDILRRTTETVRYNQVLQRQKRELQHLTDELRSANRRLRDLDQLKAEFIATITHELRTPVTSIKSLAAILEKETGMDPAQRAAFLRIIVNESERLSRLVQQTLEAETIDQAPASSSYHRTRVRALALETLDSLRVLADERGGTLRLDLPDDDVTVDIPPDRLRQVFVNLVGNAVKFIPAGEGVITLAGRTTGDHLELSVTDNGPGVPPAQAEHIFDRFVQVHDAERGKPNGTGLGLYITRRIVERAGGRIRLDAGYTGGARFVLDLPVA